MHFYVLVFFLVNLCAVVQNAPQQSDEVLVEVGNPADSKEEPHLLESDIFSIDFKAGTAEEEVKKKANVIGFKKLKTIVIGFEDDNQAYPLTIAVDFNAGYSILANEELNVCVLNKLPHLADYEIEFALLKETKSGEVLPNAFCNYEILKNISEHGEIVKEVCKKEGFAIELTECHVTEQDSKFIWADPLEVLSYAYPFCTAGVYICDTFETCGLACISGIIHDQEYFHEETLPLGSENGPKGFASGAQFVSDKANGIFSHITMGTAYAMGTVYIETANHISIAVNVYGNDRCAVAEFPDDKDLMDIIQDYEEPLTPFIPLIRCDLSEEITSEKISSNSLVKAACFDRIPLQLNNCKRIPDEDIPEKINCDFVIHLYNVEVEGKGNLYCLAS